MAMHGMIFDIGGVILLAAGEGLETKWERRLGLKEGARAIGMQAILFQNTAQAIADVQACLLQP